MGCPLSVSHRARWFRCVCPDQSASFAGRQHVKASSAQTILQKKASSVTTEHLDRTGDILEPLVGAPAHESVGAFQGDVFMQALQQSLRHPDLSSPPALGGGCRELERSRPPLRIA